LKQLDGGAGPGSAATGAGGSAAAGSASGAGAAPGQLPPGAPSPLATIERHYETPTPWEDLQRWLGPLRGTNLFAFGIGTTSRDYMKAGIVGVSFGLEPGKAAYVPLTHDYTGAPEQLQADKVLAALKPILEDPERGKLGHDLKFAAHVLANHGIQLA